MKINKMKKIFLFIILLASLASFSQAVQTVNPGRSVIVSNFAIASIGGTDTSFKFRMPNGCEFYSIQTIQTDTIEGSASSLRLWGANDGASWVQVGADSLILLASQVTNHKEFTGSAWYYDCGRIQLKKNGVTDGDITIILWYSE
jgi:hypothetical protein